MLAWFLIQLVRTVRACLLMFSASPATAAMRVGWVGWTTKEEALVREVMGLEERGAAADGAFDHATGRGHVKAKTNGHYADALSRGSTVLLLIGDVLGGVNGATVRYLRRLKREAEARLSLPLPPPVAEALRGLQRVLSAVNSVVTLALATHNLLTLPLLDELIRLNRDFAAVASFDELLLGPLHRNPHVQRGAQRLSDATEAAG